MTSNTLVSGSDSGGGGGGEKTILLWLIVMAFLLVAITLLGGAVRLTDSGLSITDWRPLMGAVPPLSAADWAVAFDAYKQIPQYAAQGGISLAEFKVIFWWEWAHRLVGRLVGLVFALPFAFFWFKGWLSARDKKIYAVLLVLGGLQGFIGWFMVQSGLAERVSVAPWRLALHFGLAMVIYGCAFLLILERLGHRVGGVARASRARASRASRASLGLVGVVFIQLLLGAVVAGNNGGLIHQDFLWGAASPLWADLTPRLDNVAFWQLAHRLNGWAVLGLAVLFFWRVQSGMGANQSAERGHLGVLPAVLAFQVGLGLIVLFSQDPLPWALFHQLGGIVCWSVALWGLTRGRV